MAGQPIKKNIEPTTDPRVKLAGFVGFVLGLLIIFKFLLWIKSGVHSGSIHGNAILWRFYQFVSVGKFVPALAHPSSKATVIAWWISYSVFGFLFALFTSFVFRLFALLLLIPSSPSMVDDPESRPMLLGVDTPELSHLDELLYCAPDNDVGEPRYIFEAIANGSMKVLAPASVSVAITDRPLYVEDMPDEAKREAKKASKRKNIGTRS